MSDLDFVLDVLRITSDYDARSDLWWHFDKDGACSLAIQCSDVFWWATCDAEQIKDSNIEILRQSFADAVAAHPHGDMYGAELFCARVRGMRPQGASYPDEPELWPLFDACGPRRVVEHGNPKKHPADRTEKPSE